MSLTPAHLRDLYLNGLPLVDPKGRPMSDAALESIIASTVAAFQRRYTLRLSPTLIRLGDVALQYTAPDLPVVTKDAPPLTPRAFEPGRHASIKLPIGPVKQVLAVGLRLPGMAAPMMFPDEWIQPDRKNKVVQLYPGARMGPLPMALSGFGLSALNSGQVIPNAWQVAYTAGYTDEDLSGDDADVGRAVGQIATIAALVPGSIDRFMMQGVAGLSVSVDGLSNSTQLLQSAGNIRYAALIAAMQASLEPWEKMFQTRRGLQMAHA